MLECVVEVGMCETEKHLQGSGAVGKSVGAEGGDVHLRRCLSLPLNDGGRRNGSGSEEQERR